MKQSTPPPYTQQQVLNNLQEMAHQLRDYPPNLEGGPGWCRKQAQDIVDRGIEVDRLAAAAPELLRALQQMEFVISECSIGKERLSDLFPVKLKQARAAIAKATGKEAA